MNKLDRFLEVLLTAIELPQFASNAQKLKEDREKHSSYYITEINKFHFGIQDWVFYLPSKEEIDKYKIKILALLAKFSMHSELHDDYLYSDNPTLYLKNQKIVENLSQLDVELIESFQYLIRGVTLSREYIDHKEQKELYIENILEIRALSDIEGIEEIFGQPTSTDNKEFQTGIYGKHYMIWYRINKNTVNSIELRNEFIKKFNVPLTEDLLNSAAKGSKFETDILKFDIVRYSNAWRNHSKEQLTKWVKKCKDSATLEFMIENGITKS